METTVKDRLIKYLEYKHIGRNKFEKTAGISTGYISNLKSSPSSTILVKILKAAPDLNPDWLLYGHGNMLLSDEPAPSGGYPYYMDLPVSAGQIEQYPSILRESATGTINIPQAKGAEFFFPVIGMSMQPTINEGEIIGVTHISSYETANADRVYMIITRDNERMIKRILQYDPQKGTLLLGSDNPSYPPFTISLSMIVDVYKVVVHLTVHTL